MDVADYAIAEREHPHIMPGLEVFDGGGHKIGTVAHVYEPPPAAEEAGRNATAGDAVMEVRTGLFGLGRHYYIPVGAVTDVTIGGAFLRRPKAEFDAAWQTKPDYVAHPVQLDRPVAPAHLAEPAEPVEVTPREATSRAPWIMEDLDAAPAGAAGRRGWER